MTINNFNLYVSEGVTLACYLSEVLQEEQKKCGAVRVSFTSGGYKIVDTANDCTCTALPAEMAQIFEQTSAKQIRVENDEYVIVTNFMTVKLDFNNKVSLFFFSSH